MDANVTACFAWERMGAVYWRWERMNGRKVGERWEGMDGRKVGEDGWEKGGRGWIGERCKVDEEVSEEHSGRESCSSL
jgi:hypothetical protein